MWSVIEVLSKGVRFSRCLPALPLTLSSPLERLVGVWAVVKGIENFGSFGSHGVGEERGRGPTDDGNCTCSV
jgi:hypothetical protein